MAYKLLLADDSITIQKVVELVLAEEDFEIKSVSNGEDAFNAMDSFRPDIVLADIDMPKMNGYQLCEKVKQNPKTSGIPVILLAGAFEPIDEELAAKVGSDDSVIKPFESQELISKINSALTMGAAGGPEEMPFAETEEEAIAIMEEAGETSGAEAVEMVGAEEDLWAMEGASEEIGELAEEVVPEEEETGIEEAFEISDEAMFSSPAARIPEPFAQPAARAEFAMPEVAAPSKEEVLKLFDKAVREKVTAVLASSDIRDAVMASLASSMKESVEKILWEVTPELVEKMLKQVLAGSFSSLSGQIEKVIWETVPDLAGTMISKEIEKIKSQF